MTEVADPQHTQEACGLYWVNSAKNHRKIIEF